MMELMASASCFYFLWQIAPKLFKEFVDDESIESSIAWFALMLGMIAVWAMSCFTIITELQGLAELNVLVMCVGGLAGAILYYANGYSKISLVIAGPLAGASIYTFINYL